MSNCQCHDHSGWPMIWTCDFHVGGLKFENPCQWKQEVCLLVKLVVPGLPSAGYPPMWFASYCIGAGVTLGAPKG